jgi:hypothetical protein
VAAAVGVAATTIRMEILGQPADLSSP